MLVAAEVSFINNNVRIMNNNINTAFADLNWFSAHKPSFQQFKGYNNINMLYLINYYYYCKED